MRRRGSRLRLRGAVLAAGLAAVTVSALSATTSVSASRAGAVTAPIGVNDLKPAACASLTLTTLVVGTNGTGGDDLLLGSAAGETLRGGPGNDCILGGGGNDTIRGEQGTDVCIGGPGTDTFHPTCETQIQ